MEIIKEEAFRKQLRRGLSGGYLFYGDEDYLKIHMQKTVRESICSDPSFALFNDVRLDALDYTPTALVNALMPPPMMSDKKLVCVNGLSLNAMKASEIEDLCEAAMTVRDYDYNILIVSVPAGQMDEGSSPKRPSAMLSKLGEALTPVLFESIPEGRLSAWVGKHLAFHGAAATPDVCAFIVSYCGRSMFCLSAETEKLAFYALSQNRTQVTREDVIRVCCPVIETDAFALANAILDGKYEEALSALSVMKFRRTDPINVLSEISRVICDLVAVKALSEEGLPQSEIAQTLKMNDYKARLYVGGISGKSMARLKRALSLCAEADRALKLSPQGYLSIEKLICSL